MADKIFIRDLKVDCVIGCGPDERVKTQRLVVNLTLHLDISACGDSDNLHDTVNYSAVAKRLAALVGRSRCYTLEALSTGIIADVFMTPDCARVEAVTVRIDKPEAFSKLPAVPCVEITRNRSYFSNRRQRRASSIWRADAAAATAAAEAAASTVDPTVDGRVGVVTAYLAIGTNIGDRVANISTAMRLLQTVPADLAVNPSSVAAHSAPFVRLVATSFLYETPPAYVLDQPPFLNGALCVETNLAPLALLDHIKANVEGAMGREKTLRFGPRNIDVDVLLYGPSQAFDLDGGRLVVPHPRLAERDFALGPLRDLCPGLLHPVHHRSITDLLAALPAVHLTRVVPLRSLASPVPGQSSERLLRLGGRTHLVGVLNVTPDSFSDGGQFFAQENSSDGSSRTSSSGGKDTVALAAGRAVEMVSQGADMVDVGGQSTRPGAQLLPAHEEAARVVPVIRALRAALPSIPISIDTFYASVAAAAVEAGADVVNDVSGGAMDAGMLAIVAQLQVPIVLMHMRGTPQTMTALAHYGPGGSGDEPADGSAVVPSVRAGLAERAAAAVTAGIPRWAIMLDPGVGFAKQAPHNYALLRPSGRLDGPASTGAAAEDGAFGAGFGLAGFPLLYGPSRKKFLGQVLRRGGADMPAPSDRVWATAAAVTACVGVGADFVRVHDVREMRDVLDAADAIFRGAGVPPLQSR